MLFLSGVDGLWWRLAHKVNGMQSFGLTCSRSLHQDSVWAKEHILESLWDHGPWRHALRGRRRNNVGSNICRDPKMTYVALKASLFGPSQFASGWGRGVLGRGEWSRVVSGRPHLHIASISADFRGIQRIYQNTPKFFFFFFHTKFSSEDRNRSIGWPHQRQSPDVISAAGNCEVGPLSASKALPNVFTELSQCNPCHHPALCIRSALLWSKTWTTVLLSHTAVIGSELPSAIRHWMLCPLTALHRKIYQFSLGSGNLENFPRQK